MTNPRHYLFYEVEHCLMCGDSTRNHTVLGQRMNRSQGFTPKKNHGITTSIVQCSKCQLIYANPTPVPKDIQDHYGIPPESYWKPSYFIPDKNYFTTEINQLKTLMNVVPGMKSLDVGAGIGKGMVSMENAGFDAHGIEASSSFYKMAIEKMKISPLKLQNASIEAASFAENSFDCITFAAVLEHLYDPAYCLSKAMTWLKPGGFMYVEVPSSAYLISKLLNFYYRIVGTNYVTNLSPMHEPFHLYEFSLKSFEEHAKQSGGYAIAFHEYYVCSAEPFPRFMQSLLTSWMHRRKSGMQLSVWLRKN